jgi:hypothetical protein
MTTLEEYLKDIFLEISDKFVKQQEVNKMILGILRDFDERLKKLEHDNNQRKDNSGLDFS